MTHPFHPLCGREYVFFTIRHSWSEERVYFRDERGEIKALPIVWTSAAAPDPFVLVAAGRCTVRLEDLLQMMELIGALTPDERCPTKARRVRLKS